MLNNARNMVAGIWHGEQSQHRVHQFFGHDRILALHTMQKMKWDTWIITGVWRLCLVNHFVSFCLVFDIILRGSLFDIKSLSTTRSAFFLV